MKTILLISPYWREAHRWMVSSYKLAELWQRLGFRIVVVTMGPKTETNVVSPTLTIYQKKDFFLPDPWNYGIAFGFTGLVRKVIHKEKPDVIVCNKVLFWSSLSVIALRLTGHRITLLTDALVGMTWWGRTFLFRLASRIYAWTLGWLILLLADRIVFFHPQPERLLRRLGIAAKSTVIPTGIDPSLYLGEKSSSSVTVTYVGRLESVKGVDDFLAAAQQVKKHHPDVRFRVVGLAPDAHPLRQRYSSIAEFTGLRDDIPAILRETEIFVMPSHSEGLSNAILEAMSSSCAVVASDTGGNAFLVQNGISGFLFPPGDRAALAAHLTRLIEDPSKRKMMGQAARKRIEEVFSWEVVGRQYREFFEKVPRPRPRIVLFSAFLSPYRSGAEACAEEIALRLCERFDITIVTARLARGALRRDLLQGKVSIVRVGIGHPIDKWLYPFLAPFAARKLEPVILHAVLETFAGLALFVSQFVLPRAKRLLTLQTTNRRFLRGLILRSAHRVTAISKALIDDAKHYGIEAIDLIPNGIDLPAIRSACERHSKIPGRILFVGRLESMKGVDVLLRSLVLVRKELVQSLRIVGRGSRLRELELLASSLGIADRVEFLGYLHAEELTREYAEATVFCGLSRSEALGNVFLEAEAAGCAVVATDVGGIPEIISDGETGLLVPPEDTAASAQALTRVLTEADLRASLSAQAQAFAAKYDWEPISLRYRGIYASLLPQ